MYFLNKPFWLAGLRVFSAILYYLFVVPFVFVMFAIPLWAALAWINGGAGDSGRIELFAVAFSAAVIMAHYRRKRGKRCQ